MDLMQSSGGRVWKVATAVLAVAAIVLGALAINFSATANRERTTVNEQAQAAAEAAKAEQKKVDEAEFAEREKLPYRTYTAPSVLISLNIKFPKNWNLYVEQSSSSTTQLNVYGNPGLVQSPRDFGGPYALRVNLERTLYAKIVAKRANQVEKGELVATPITVSGLKGTRYTGKISGAHTGVLVVLPVRDKTLSLWTESHQNTADFNKIIERIALTP